MGAQVLTELKWLRNRYNSSHFWTQWWQFIFLQVENFCTSQAALTSITTLYQGW